MRWSLTLKGASHAGSYRPVRSTHVCPWSTSPLATPFFCCEGMARQWGRLVAFGVAGKATTGREVCLGVPRPQANGTPILEVVPMECCPWRAAPVETCRVK